MARGHDSFLFINISKMPPGSEDIPYTMLKVVKPATIPAGPAGRLVTDFIRGFDKSSFVNDWKTHSAVLYQLTVIGEAVKRLSKDFREQHSQIPWGLMAGMRDNLIHGYDLIDWDEVWKTASSDVPDLLSKIESIAKK